MNCSVPECELPVRCRALCAAHYKRFQQGRPMDGPIRRKPRGSFSERFWRYAERGDTAECWLWTGYLDPHGYGRIGRGGRGANSVFAHRAAYEMLVGPIPDGLVIDHLCRVRHCVNPAHLEPVTLDENKRRGQSPAEQNRSKTHCVRGHEFTPENTIHKDGGRSCRACKNERDLRRYYAMRPEGTWVPGGDVCRNGHSYENNVVIDRHGVRRCATCRRSKR